MKKESPLALAVKPTLYGNWSDTWAFPLTAFFLPLVIKIRFLTPNAITLLGFISYCAGSALLFLDMPNHLLFAAFLLVFGFLMDDLDGQVARARNLKSELGNLLDKFLDVIKIAIVCGSLSYAVFLQTQQIYSIYLGFIAASFFYIRYYIKLETVLRQTELDPNYLIKSKKTMDLVEEKTQKEQQLLSKTLGGKLKVLWLQNRTILLVDEAEFAVFTAFFAVLNRLELALFILAISQVIITIFRAYERTYQTITKSDRLYYFMRK